MAALKDIVDASHLDFAILHVSSFYDTDFFPRAEEFRAISNFWPEIRQWMLNRQLGDFLSESPLVIPWPKTRGGFRLVHRLEPFAAIVYTALAKRIAIGVERARMPSQVACSYRLRDLQNSFFADGSGYDVFKNQCETLSQQNTHVLCADITDFYNKIYLHRLANAIQQMSDDPSGISNKIEYFLTELNTKASQGIPVGPAASIVFSEATLDDVDRFIHNRGFDHARYVDDIRIFGSKGDLQTLLQDLTMYLHSAHRLTLNSEKTYIVKNTEFLESEINNHYQEERLQIFGDLENVNPYAMHSGEDDDEDEDDSGDGEGEDAPASESEAAELLTASVERMLQYPTLDLGLIRAIVRSARARKISTITNILLDNTEFFSPAINDIIIYFDAVTDDQYCETYLEKFGSICESNCMRFNAVAMWFHWYFARHKKLLEDRRIRTFVLRGKEMRHQAQAALTRETPEWVREHKSTMLRLGSADRRSVILASASLSPDERDKWLGPLIRGSSLNDLEKWMAKWVLAGSPIVRPAVTPLDLEDFL